MERAPVEAGRGVLQDTQFGSGMPRLAHAA